MTDEKANQQEKPDAPAAAEVEEQELDNVAGGGYGTSTVVTHNDSGISNAHM